MTLRDLTPRELYNLQRRCMKLWREWLARPQANIPSSLTPSQEAWTHGYNAGLRDGLAKGEKKA